MSNYFYLKIIYKANPIEIKNSAYWFKFLVIIYKENPIEIKNSAYWFKYPVIIIFVRYYLSRISSWNEKMTQKII